MQTVVAKLLESAEAVLSAQGVNSLTLDAVAKHAGVSKGGLLHYFPTKNALLSALVKHHIDAWRSDLMQAYDRQKPGPGRFARALIDQCLNPDSVDSNNEAWSEKGQSSCRVIMSAVIRDTSLVQPIRDLHVEFTKMIDNDGLPPGHTDIVVAVTDAMWLYWLCDIQAFDEARLRRVRKALQKLIQPHRTRTTAKARPKESKKFTRR